MRKHLLLLLLLFSCLSLESAVHPFYLSVTEIELNTQTKEAKVSCRLFIDDIQQELYQTKHKKVNLLQITAENKKLLESYLLAHLQLQLGKESIPLKLIGYEIEEEAVWSYLEGPIKDKSTHLSIQNSLLCSTLTGQTNIMHCTLNGKKQSARIICPNTKQVFDF